MNCGSFFVYKEYKGKFFNEWIFFLICGFFARINKKEVSGMVILNVVRESIDWWNVSFIRKDLFIV